MLTFIVNPAAGSGYTRRVEKTIVSGLKRRNMNYRVLHTEYPGHATELARKAAQDAECTAVIAVGGDGTDYEVACGLLDTDMPLGIIPAGTGNDFIKSVGIPKDPLQALEFILTHQPRPVDVGSMNERLFLNVCGTGFDVTVLDCMTAAKKYARGILPYLIGLVQGIAHYKPVHVRFTVDDKPQERDVLLCSIANGHFIGGGIPICPDASPDDGMLDLVVVENRPRWMIPFYLPGLMMGKVLKFGVTSHIRCKSATFAAKGMRLNVDGEILPLNEATFTIQPGKLRLYW